MEMLIITITVVDNNFQGSWYTVDNYLKIDVNAFCNIFKVKACQLTCKNYKCIVLLLFS